MFSKELRLAKLAPCAWQKHKLLYIDRQRHDKTPTQAQQIKAGLTQSNPSSTTTHTLHKQATMPSKPSQPLSLPIHLCKTLPPPHLAPAGAPTQQANAPHCCPLPNAACPYCKPHSLRLMPKALCARATPPIRYAIPTGYCKAGTPAPAPSR